MFTKVEVFLAEIFTQFCNKFSIHISSHKQ
jgi:hypothetical protein